MKIRNLLQESADIIQGGEKQKLIDPADALHTGQVDDWITIPLDKFSEYIKQNNLKFFNPDDVPEKGSDSRGSYKLSVNAIPLNQKNEDDEYAHVIKVKITGKGRNDNDPRSFVFYIMYSDDEFANSFVGNRLYPVGRVDQLPIYATNTGIGSNRISERDYWSYLAQDYGNTKSQDKLNPRDFPQLNKNSFIDTHGTTGISGNPGEKGTLQRKAELDIPDDNISPEQRLVAKQKNQSEIESQNNKIISALTAKKLTAAGMVKIIKNTRGSGGSYRSKLAMQYLSDLTEAFTKTPNSPGSIYPLQLADSNDSMKLIKDIGIQGVNSIAVDFMEVLHPVILLYGNCNGNAKNMAESFFGATQEELVKNATISYTRDASFPLIDSAIFFKSDNSRGFRRLGISTKQQGGASGAGGSKFPSLQVAWREVEAIANDKWNEQVQPLLNKNPKFKLAWEAIRYKMAVTGVELPPKLVNELAVAFGTDSTDPVEVFLKVADSPEFKQLIIWIFNHSATIQIDTRADYGDDNRPAVITNIVATWPTQLASSVEVSKSGDSIKLVVNGVVNDFTPEIGDRTDVDYSATSDAEERYRPGDYADDKGNVAVNKLDRFGGGITTVNYGRTTSKTVNPYTFTTVPLSAIGKPTKADGAVRYSLIRLARLVSSGFKYLPYDKFTRWVRYNQLDEARGKSDTRQAQADAEYRNADYVNLLSQHGIPLNIESVSKFPVGANIAPIDSFSKNQAFIANRGRVDYNQSFIEALQSISSSSTGDPKIAKAIEDLIRVGQSDSKLLTALETEALAVSEGAQIPAVVTKYLSDYMAIKQNAQRVTQQAQAPQQAVISPEEQRIQRIIAAAKADGRAKDEVAARKEIIDYGDEPEDEIARALTEHRSRILKGILG